MAQVLSAGANAAVPAGNLKIVATHGGPETDLSALLLQTSGKVRNDNDFVFFGQPNSPDGSVKYSDKQNTGGIYRHEMQVALASVPAAIEKVVFTLTIDPSTPKTFAEVTNLNVSIVDATTGNEIASLQPRGTKENAFIVGEFYRRNGAWKVRCVGQGFENGLAGIATTFGVDIADSPAPGSTASAAPQPVPPPPAPPAPTVNLTKPAPVGKVSLKKGNTIRIAKSPKITATGAWDNTWLHSLDYDLFAHIAYRDGTLEVVNYDNLRSRNGAVQHHGDLLSAGTEVITVEMTDDIAAVGFSFYSARENGTGSFAHAKARVSLDNGEGSAVTLGVSEMSVDANRYTLYFGTVINRGPEAVEVVACESYSEQDSELQAVLYPDGHHEMDAGPENRYK